MSLMEELIVDFLIGFGIDSLELIVRISDSNLFVDNNYYYATIH
jgi:hypothetical protein